MAGSHIDLRRSRERWSPVTTSTWKNCSKPCACSVRNQTCSSGLSVHFHSSRMKSPTTWWYSRRPFNIFRHWMRLCTMHWDIWSPGEAYTVTGRKVMRGMRFRGAHYTFSMLKIKCLSTILLLSCKHKRLNPFFIRAKDICFKQYVLITLL